MARHDRITRQKDGKEIPDLFHHAFIHNGDTYYKRAWHTQEEAAS